MKKLTVIALDPKAGMTISEINAALNDAAEILGEDMDVKVRITWGGRIKEMILEPKS